MTDPTDNSLWDKEVEDVKPLDRNTSKKRPKPIKNKDIIIKTDQLAYNVPKSSRTNHARDIDARTLQRLKRGQIPIEARLDMHGMTRHQAYDALYPFILRTQSSGKRCVLVITGKGQKDHEMQGVLRQSLPEWLSEERYNALVLTHVPANKRDGGGGAFYIYLRRQR